MCALSILSMLYASLALAPDGQPGQAPDEFAHRQLVEKRGQLLRVTTGMTEQRVRELMGKPDEVRAAIMDVTSLGWGPEVESKWVYGVKRPGEFAKIGVVGFNADGKALQVCVPTLPPYIRISAIGVPLSDEPVPTPAGVYWEIGSVHVSSWVAKEWGRWRAQLVEVSLVNGGTKPYFYTHSLGPVPCVHEIYDANKRILLRWDQRDVASIYKDITLKPGDRKTFDALIWRQGCDVGDPPPGTYYVRLLFSDLDGSVYPSNLLRFEVPADARKDIDRAGK